MAVIGQRIAPRRRFTLFNFRALRQALDQDRWMTYGTYFLFGASVLTAAFSRAIGGLKPGDILLVLFTLALVIRRVQRKDYSFAITPVDTAFLLIIFTGTFLPAAMMVVRHIYLSKDAINALAGPIEYYLWYRVILEALPLPQRLPTMMKVIVSVLSVISVIGVLQIAHFPGVESFLKALYPTYETLESPAIHRATSVVGGWETLAAIAAYTIVLINQIQTKETTVQRFGGRWKWLLIGMLAFNVVALLSTLSVAGLLAIVVGYLLAWRLNGALARETRIALIAAVVGALALTPYILQRFAFQFNNPANTSHHAAVPTTWASRGLHWKIVLVTVLGGVGTLFFGVQPSFAYPVLDFGSTESLYLLLLYRGGLIYIIGFLAFAFIVCRYIWRIRQREHGFNKQILTGIFTVLIVNFAIDILDAHFFSAGEWQILMTLIALAVGISLRTDANAPQAEQAEEQATAMRVPALRMDSVWDQRTRLSLGGLLVCVVLAMGMGAYRNRHLVAPPTTLKVTYYDGSAPSSMENQILGTRNWELTAGTNTSFIEGYADKASAIPGDQVQLFISTAHPTSYDIEVYRMGWYYGLGGRLYAKAHISKSQQQGYWANGSLHGCQCQPDATTHLIDAGWQPSYTLNVGPNWLSGVYLIKLRAPQGESYIPLVVKEKLDAARHSQILVSLPVMTYQAENAWGGYSFYGPDTGNGIDLYDELDPNRATKVSFNRPYANDAGAGDLLSYDLHAVRWFERSGFDVSYTTDLDVDSAPQSLVQHIAFVALGHDEYWTKAMRDGLEHARDAGVSLGFFGAQDGYWQARLEPDAAGTADRTVVCYKVGLGTAPELDNPKAQLSPPSADPDYAHRDKRQFTTARWRDPILNRPENELLGIQFDGFIFRVPPTDIYLPDWRVRSGDLDSLTRNSTFSPGETASGGLLGYAYDALGNNGQTPIGLSILGQSSVVDNTGSFRIANTTYYRATSNAVVFDAGSVWWSWSMDEFTFRGADHPNVLLGVEHIETLNNNMIRTLLGPGHVPPPAGQPIQ